MLIYVVCYNDGECLHLEFAYTDKEKAEAYCKEYNKKYNCSEYGVCQCFVGIPLDED